MLQKLLAAALAVWVGWAAAGVALAQTQDGGAAAPPTKAPPLVLPSADAPLKPADANANQPVYSVKPPADSSSGTYLPGVVGGYAKSAAGCVVVGCDEGPKVDSAPPGSDTPPPPPANPGPKSGPAAGGP
jgi:hypothetical protein